MIDTHSHILPFVDDGAKSIEESVTLLKMQKEQGADYVIATPHFSNDTISLSQFLSKREQSYNLLKGEIEKLGKESFPEISVACEVMLTENITEIDDFSLLCMPDKRHILIEFPMFNCDNWIFDKLFEITATKCVTPIIAHVERYIMTQNDRFIKKLLELNLPLQFSLSVAQNRHEFKKFNKFFKLAPELFRYIGSDCHNTESRAPNIDKYYPALVKKLGKNHMDYVLNCSNKLIST